MALDPVVLALRAALDRADSTEVRLALGEQLLKLGHAADALAEFERILSSSPSHPAALDGAARAAKSAGDVGKAHAYALAASTGSQATARVQAEEAHDDEDDDDEDDEAPEPSATSKGLRLVASDGALVTVEDRPAVLFADVAGMDEVKARLNRSFVHAVKNPLLYQKFGKTIGGGLVLYGPPGCGKTYLARALAGEIGARFINIGLSDVLDMWFGESERKLHELFENARRLAPTVMFFDEVDALGQRRAQLKGSAGRTLVNQLLSELDGAGQRNDGVFFLGATNHPWDLDPALRRPGRFNRLMFVSPPDAPARRRLLETSLAGRPLSAKVDLDRLAKSTEGFSGADLVAMVGEATELAIGRSMDSGKEVPIDTELLDQAQRSRRASTRPWFETARNYAVYANEGGTYDDMLAYMKKQGLA